MAQATKNLVVSTFAFSLAESRLFALRQSSIPYVRAINILALFLPSSGLDILRYKIMGRINTSRKPKIFVKILMQVTRDMVQED